MSKGKSKERRLVPCESCYLADYRVVTADAAPALEQKLNELAKDHFTVDKITMVGTKYMAVMVRTLELEKEEEENEVRVEQNA